MKDFQEDPLGSDLLINWDTVFAIRYPDVNAGIRAGKKTPPGFSMPLSSNGSDFLLEGTFDPWMVVPKGNGHLVRLRLPVPEVYFEQPDKDPQKFRNGWFEITVSLSTIMRDAADVDEGSYVDFMVEGPQNLAGPISLKDMYLEPMPSGDDANYINYLMKAWLNDHLEDFRHIFCTINIKRKVKSENFQWFQPTFASYAVADDRKTMESGVFGVLCMTENRKPPKDQLIDLDAIPKNERSAFLISKERFMTKFLIGQLGSVFSGPAKEDPKKKWPEDYFEMSSSNNFVTNNARLRIDKVLIGTDDPQEYTCHVDENGLQVTFQNTSIEVMFNKLTHGYYPVLGEWWLRVEHEIINDYVIYLDPETQIIDLTPEPKFPGGKKLKVGTHKVEIFKTQVAKDIDLVLTILGIVLAFAPLIGKCVGWLSAVAEVAEETEETALLVTDLIEDGEADSEQMDDLAEEAAEDALNVEEGEPAPLASTSERMRAWMKAGFMRALPFVPLAASHYLQAYANRDKVKLPKYREFAGAVLAPIKWPAAETEYTLHDVRLADSLQTYGDWKIKDTNKV